LLAEVVAGLRTILTVVVAEVALADIALQQDFQ
jgi:hypothetical protein